jgi:hypothetical protein
MDMLNGHNYETPKYLEEVLQQQERKLQRRPTLETDQGRKKKTRNEKGFKLFSVATQSGLVPPIFSLNVKTMQPVML